MVGKEVFYAALWGSVLVSPAIRLPASLFVVGHISRDSPGKEQKYMLGTDYQLTVGALLLAWVQWGVHDRASWATGRHWGCGGASESSREREVLRTSECVHSAAEQTDAEASAPTVKPGVEVFVFNTQVNGLHTQTRTCT